jgi:hypothetical protein
MMISHEFQFPVIVDLQELAILRKIQLNKELQFPLFCSGRLTAFRLSLKETWNYLKVFYNINAI